MEAGPNLGIRVLRAGFLPDGTESWANAKKDETEHSVRGREKAGERPVWRLRGGIFRLGKKKEAARFRRTASQVNQSSSVGRMVSTGQVAFFTTFSATEPNRIRSMPLRPRVPITMMSACSLSARARISSAA